MDGDKTSRDNRADDSTFLDGIAPSTGDDFTMEAPSFASVGDTSFTKLTANAEMARSLDRAMVHSTAPRFVRSASIAVIWELAKHRYGDKHPCEDEH